jgi:hypothetical protein
MRGDGAKTAIEWVKLLAAIIALIAVGEIPMVHAFSGWIDANRFWLFPFTLGLTVTGFLVMIWAWVVVGVKYGRPMTHEEVDRLTVQRLKGWTAGKWTHQWNGRSRT